MIKPNERQTTVRIDKELLRRAYYFLDRDGSNLNKFLTEHLHEYLTQHHAMVDPQTTPELTFTGEKND